MGFQDWRLGNIDDCSYRQRLQYDQYEPSTETALYRILQKV